MEKYLPIGTVVLLKNAIKRVMITGYFPIVKTDGGEEKKDYSACLFPEGNLEMNKILAFNHEQIESVYYYGLIDEEQKEFSNFLSNNNSKEINNESSDSKSNSNYNFVTEYNDIDILN